MARVRALLQAHNDRLRAESAANMPEGVAGNSKAFEDSLLKIDDFFKKLTGLGGSTEDTLAEATWEDLESCGLPRILARKVATIFRGEQQVSGPVVPQRVIMENRLVRQPNTADLCAGVLENGLTATELELVLRGRSHAPPKGGQTWAASIGAHLPKDKRFTRSGQPYRYKLKD